MTFGTMPMMSSISCTMAPLMSSGLFLRPVSGICSICSSAWLEILAAIALEIASGFDAWLPEMRRRRAPMCPGCGSRLADARAARTGSELTHDRLPWRRQAHAHACFESECAGADFMNLVPPEFLIWPSTPRPSLDISRWSALSRSPGCTCRP